MKILLYILFTLFLGGFSSQRPKDYVPDSTTAIKIAEAVWLPIYGNNIYKKTPFIADLQGDTVWHVFGSLPSSGINIDSNGDTTFTVVTGGVPHIFLNKSDGKILDVYHTK